MRNMQTATRKSHRTSLITMTNQSPSCQGTWVKTERILIVVQCGHLILTTLLRFMPLLLSQSESRAIFKNRRASERNQAFFKVTSRCSQQYHQIIGNKWGHRASSLNKEGPRFSLIHPSLSCELKPRSVRKGHPPWLRLTMVEMNNWAMLKYVFQPNIIPRSVR